MARYTVMCAICGEVELDYDNYMRQLSNANSGWYCPRCGKSASFYGEYYDCINEGCNGQINNQDSDICPECGESQMELYDAL